MALTPFLFLLSAIYSCRLQVCSSDAGKKSKRSRKMLLRNVFFIRFLWGLNLLNTPRSLTTRLSVKFDAA